MRGDEAIGWVASARFLRSAAILGLALLVLSLSASAAGATPKPGILVGQGAAGVSLGDSKQKVKQVLGEPFRTSGASSFYAKPCLCTLTFKGGTVQRIDTLSKSQRTDKGVGPGSSYGETLSAYPEAKCSHRDLYGDTSRFCTLLSEAHGQRVKTVFVFFEEDLPMRDVEISAAS
jgi:hypothetical protein